MKWFRSALLFCCLLPALPTAHAITLRISPEALQRTLERQLFNGPDHRYYLRGGAGSPCYTYAEDPHVSFSGQRVVVRMVTHSRLGTVLNGACLGFPLTLEGEVSLLPEAQGEVIGFRDARVGNLASFGGLEVLIKPFLARKVPQQMRFNAADLIRTLLSRSRQSTGYELQLRSMSFRSMQVQDGELRVDLDGDLSVR